MAKLPLLTLGLFLCSCSLVGNVEQAPTDAEGISAGDRAALDGALVESSDGSIEIENTPIYPPLVVPDRPEVRRFIQYYSTTRKRFVAESLERRKQFHPQLARVFRSHGLPEELIAMAMVESGFKSEASSHMGAVGMWQFISSTARHYGLRVALWKDERRDVLKSTVAAARHMRDLYEQFGDWYLAIAAYNGGAGRMRRAMKEAGSNDFFDVARSGVLRKETSEYVPKTLALVLISRAPGRYGF